MFTKTGIFVLLAAMAGSSAAAQIGSGSAQVSSSSMVGGFSAGANEFQRNQPYTLKQEMTTLRTLADGTHITTVREEIRIRDAEGRTRTEIARDGQSPLQFHFVTVSDPIAHTWISLDDRNKVAHVNHLPAPKLPTPEQEAQMAEMRAKALGARAAQPQADTAPASQSSPKVRREVEDLPPRTIAGVAAEGRRTTRVIPAGKEGNDRDLTTTTETWTSPELHVVLERTIEDPRNGKMTLTTLSLERISPDPALFRIPADYKIVDQQPSAMQ